MLLPLETGFMYMWCFAVGSLAYNKNITHMCAAERTVKYLLRNACVFIYACVFGSFAPPHWVGLK